VLFACLLHFELLFDSGLIRLLVVLLLCGESRGLTFEIIPYLLRKQQMKSGLLIGFQTQRIHGVP
jgi:hypothetical protein